jgi:hypothetical protein
MASLNTQVKYTLSIYFPGMEDRPASDIIHFAIVRTPIVKQASFMVVRMNLRPPVVQQLMNRINDNFFPTNRVVLYAIDESKDGKKITPLLDVERAIISVKPETELSITQSSMTAVTLILVDPILYQMSTSLTFNKSYTAKRGIDVVNDYEKTMDSIYSSNSFYTNRIIDKINPHIYNQIMVNPRPQSVKLDGPTPVKFSFNSDIDVVPFIQLNYKVTNAFSFYFYDEFDTSRPEPITRHFITLYDYNIMKTVDISKYGDIRHQTVRLGASSVSDSSRFLDKGSLENIVFNYRTPDMLVKSVKVLTSMLKQSKATSSKEIELTEGRTANLSKGILEEKKIQQGLACLNVKVPDSPENAKERIDLTLETLKGRIDCVEHYYTNNCSFDWLQFGKRYNMSQERPSEYIYSPIAIANIFQRVNPKEDWLSHHARYSMIKFY